MLALTVRWVDGRYHGEEWPPSPLRLFQAMLAGYRIGRPVDPALDAAMRHLERLPPPEIVAPVPTPLALIATAVPNNDGDKVFEHLVKDDVARANKIRSEQLRVRRRRPYDVESAVTYRWPGDADTPRHVDALARIARSMTVLGQGGDFCWATLDADARDQPAGVAFRPTEDGRRRLRVPYPGVLDTLERRHAAFLARVGPDRVASVAEPRHRTQGYRSELEPPELRHVTFRLARPDDRTWSVDGTECLRVVGMVRHVLHRAATAAGFDDDRIATLMGHGSDGGDERLRVVPLPNAGYRHADGWVRRVMITAPLSVSDAEWQALLLRTAGAELVPEDGGEPVASLVAARFDDPMVRRLTATARTWTTATPVVLPGFDTRRGRPRPDKALRRVLRHASFSETLVDTATLEPSPRAQGAAYARRYRRPRHLASLPATHLTIAWRTPVAGPLCLGAGDGYGLGLMVPLDTPPT